MTEESEVPGVISTVWRQLFYGAGGTETFQSFLGAEIVFNRDQSFVTAQASCGGVLETTWMDG